MKRRDKYYHHIENVRIDEDFWPEYLNLMDKAGRPEFFHPAITSLKDLKKTGSPEAVAVFQGFLDKWGIDDETLRTVIVPRGRWEVHPSEIRASLNDGTSKGQIALEFQEDITQTEFILMWSLVESEQDKRGIANHHPNSTSQKSARAAYLARKMKKESPKTKWKDIALAVNKELDSEYDHNTIAKRYREFYRAKEDHWA